jgi:hypothetical protein
MSTMRASGNPKGDAQQEQGSTEAVYASARRVMGLNLDKHFINWAVWQSVEAAECGASAAHACEGDAMSAERVDFEYELL